MLTHKKLFSDDEIEKRTIRLEDARALRSDQTKKNDLLVLEMIRENPKISSTEIEKKFRQHSTPFERSYLINALKRLEEEQKISFEYFHESNRINKKYSVNYNNNQKLQPGTITISKMLFLDSKEWQSFGRAYAMKNNVIKISPNENEKLEEISFFNLKIPVEQKNNTIQLQMPQPMLDYYDLDVNNYRVQVEKNIVTIFVIPKPTIINKNLTNSKRILLMEDKDYWRIELTKGFVKAGHRVDSTDSSRVALANFTENYYDYVILDWDIHNKKEGEDLFINFKKINPNIKGTLITSHSLETHWDRLQELGFNGIIRKRRFGEEEQNEDEAIEQIINEQLVNLETI